MSLLLEGVGAAQDSKARAPGTRPGLLSHLTAPACAFATWSHQFLGDRRLQNVGASQPHHLLTVGPWTGGLTPLSLSFPTCQVEICYLGALGSDIETT